MALDEALVLRHKRNGASVFVTHGHQVDLKSDRLLPLSRMIVRHIWRRIQSIDFLKRFYSGVRRSAIAIEARLKAWTQAHRQLTICGHTHQPAAASYGDAPYFNTGSFIEPGRATGLEIQGGEICLVRWTEHPVTHGVRRELVTPPRKLALFA
jgi:predicted phosphodiesterase